MRKPSVLLIALLSFGLTLNSHAFLNFFKGDLDKVPESEEMRVQEAEASELVKKATELETAGKQDKALDVYRGVVKKYPITTAAAMSQYKIGAIQKDFGDYVKAFASFQEFVDNYKQSSAFDAAIASQYEIARASQSGEHKEKFIGISRKVQRSEVLSMYQSVIKNAPYSEYAPQAQFSIGQVLEEDGKRAEAVAAYGQVVSSYPKTALAADAQYRIGEIGSKAIEDGSQNVANVNSSREAYEELLLGYDDDARREEAQNRVVQFNELEAKKAFEVGQFYEKQKKYKSAALYYRRVAQSSGTSAAAEASERLAIMEAKLASEPTSAEVEETGGDFKPVAAVGGAVGSAATRLKEAVPRPRLGSRLFGRKDREEEARMAAVESAPAPKPAPVQPAAAAKPSTATVSSPQVASVPAGTGATASKRKGYYGPPKPELALGKKQNNMRLDTSKLQDVPFDISKLDKDDLGKLGKDDLSKLGKDDLEKGLKKIAEAFPDKGIPAELPDDLSDLVIPGGDEEEDLETALKKVAEEVEDEELTIPALPEEGSE